MLETYAVGVKLEMASNVAGVLDQVMRDTERFNTLLKESSAGLGKLARDLRGLRGSGSSIGGIEKMAEALRTAETAGMGLTRALRNNAEYATETAKAMQSAAKAMEQAGRAQSAAPGGGHRNSRFSEHNVMMAGMGAGLVGGALIGGVRHAITPAIDVARTTDVLAADMRLTPEQVKQALGVARATTQLAPGSTVGENMAGLLDLKTVFGDLKEAQELLPKFAQMTALFATLDKRGGGSGSQTFAAAKALEIMGGMIDEHTDATGHTVRNIDPELGMKRLKEMERAAVATNMRVLPSDYLGFAKQARVAGMTLTDEFTYEKLPAMIAALGGQRVGTALMSMAQVFEGGKLEAKSMEALQSIGLAGKGGLTTERDKRTGKLKQVVHSSAIFDGDMMLHDPQKYLELAQKRMEAKGIHGTEAQIKALMKAAQRSTIAGIFADLLKDAPSILKEQENIRNTRPDMAEHMAAVDPAAKILQFEAAMTNFATELGSAGMGDAMKVLDAATAGLNKLGEWAKEYPTIGRIAFDTGAGLGAVATGLGALSTAILVFGPALRLLGLVGGGATAAVAGTGGATAAAGVAGVLGAGAVLPTLAVGAAVGTLAAGSSAYTPENNAAIDKLARQRMTVSPANMPTSDGFGADGRPMQINGDVYLDANKVGRVIGKAMSGPNAGTTGFDLRTGHHGAMAHP